MVLAVIFPALITSRMVVVIVAASCLLLIAVTGGTSCLFVTAASCISVEKCQQLPEV